MHRSPPTLHRRYREICNALEAVERSCSAATVLMARFGVAQAPDSSEAQPVCRLISCLLQQQGTPLVLDAAQWALVRHAILGDKGRPHLPSVREFMVQYAEVNGGEAACVHRMYSQMAPGSFRLATAFSEQ